MYRHQELSTYLSHIRLAEKKRIQLSDFDTEAAFKYINKNKGEDLLEEGIKQLNISQDKLYAHNRFGVLIVFQAMDAAGKDGAIKHVMSGLNPAGVKVHSFKTPNSLELDHDYLWRHYLALPSRGDICIFNRSHYENVLITRVHPEYILKEQLPGINQIEDITDSFWQQRFKQIRRFEHNLVENGMVIIKFFLHLSKEEQKKRFLERINNPQKNWKFSFTDVTERKYWTAYQKAYEDVISETATPDAPWHIIPSDDKWSARLCISAVINQTIDKLPLTYPILSEMELLKLKEAENILLSE